MQVRNQHKILSKMNTNKVYICIFRFTSIFWEISTVKVWPKSQKRLFLGKIRHGYGIFQSQSIDSDQSYSGPILGRYVRVCEVRCLLCRYAAGVTMFISSWLVPICSSKKPGKVLKTNMKKNCRLNWVSYTCI